MLGIQGMKEEGFVQEEEFSNKDLKVVTGIVIFLIMLTLTFEILKETLEKRVNAHLQIILQKLFGELTVLGFLAIVTYTVTETGWLSYLSSLIYEEEEELFQFLEHVHFTIFFIMISFVIQVSVLIFEASYTERKWLDMDYQCRQILDFDASSRNSGSGNSSSGNSSSSLGGSPGQQRRIAMQKQHAQKPNHWQSARRFVSSKFRLLRRRCRKPMQVPDTEFLIFQALRHEFILDRDLEPPFAAKSGENGQYRLNAKDFNFGRYLSLAQAHILTHIVEVEIHTWLFFAIGVILWYYIANAVHRSIEAMSWIWLSIGWAVLIGNLVFEMHLYRLHEVFVPKNILAVMYSGGGEPSMMKEALQERPFQETAPLLSENVTAFLYLPSWCDVNIQQYLLNERSIFAKFFVGGTPNRQQALFWFDRKGPAFYEMVLQMNLIFIGVYSGLLILIFLPYIMHEYNVVHSMVYITLALLPPIIITVNKRNILALLTQVTSIGTYRKTQIISDTLGREKTAQIIRTFLLINHMRRHATSSFEREINPPAQDSFASTMSHSPPPKRQLEYYDRISSSFSSLSQVDIEELSRAFDIFDQDKSGFISKSEFCDLMIKVAGKGMTQDVAETIFASLDITHDGQVSREVFFKWYEASFGDGRHEDDPQTQARELFDLFDVDECGEITVGEFKNKLEALNISFTASQIGRIINELDRDRNGSISLGEFEELIKKYWPQQSKSRRPCC